jgi:hypothetical protein
VKGPYSSLACHQCLKNWKYRVNNGKIRADINRAYRLLRYKRWIHLQEIPGKWSGREFFEVANANARLDDGCIGSRSRHPVRQLPRRSRFILGVRFDPSSGDNAAAFTRQPKKDFLAWRHVFGPLACEPNIVIQIGESPP